MGIQIFANGFNMARAKRRELISATLEAYVKAYPKKARMEINHIEAITKVEHAKGDWKNGKGHVKVRAPQDLFLCLRAMFNKVLPQEPCFADSEGDWDLLFEVCPKLNLQKIRR